MQVNTRLLSAGAAAFALGFSIAQPAERITTPKKALGFNIGDDYMVAGYEQWGAFWKKLASESDRMKLVDIGPTSEGRRQIMAILTSPENLNRLDHYRDISRRLALAEGLTDEQARALAHGGKAVIWIDGGSGRRRRRVVEASIGAGKVFLLRPDITFRGQPHATFKLLFNGVYYGAANPVTLP